MKYKYIERVVEAIVPEVVADVHHKCKAMANNAQEFLNIILECGSNISCNLILSALEDGTINKLKDDEHAREAVTFVFDTLIDNIKNFKDKILSVDQSGIDKVAVEVNRGHE